MRYFFDTEFIEDGHTIDLISIGIVAEDGRDLYLGNDECNLDLASKWVCDNVLPHLPLPQHSDPAFWKDRQTIQRAILKFAPPESKPEFWAYYADYDWVAFCQLFGKMIDLPDGYPMWCRDLKQVMGHMGFREKDLMHLPAKPENEHHALDDAHWNKAVFDQLEKHGKLHGITSYIKL